MTIDERAEKVLAALDECGYKIIHVQRGPIPEAEVMDLVKVMLTSRATNVKAELHKSQGVELRTWRNDSKLDQIFYDSRGDPVFVKPGCTVRENRDHTFKAGVAGLSEKFASVAAKALGVPIAGLASFINQQKKVGKKEAAQEKKEVSSGTT